MKNIFSSILILIIGGIAWQGCEKDPASFPIEPKPDSASIPIEQKPDSVAIGQTYKIGQTYEGGIIFYIDSTKEHGLIAAPTDQSTGIQWSNGDDTVRTGATGYKVGTGKPNTDSIVRLLGAGNYAAILCDQLVLNGKSDWFLPSGEELHLLYLQKNNVGGFGDDCYWSSTDLLGQPFAYYSMNQHFGTGSTKLNLLMMKHSLNRVRAIRAF